MSRDIHEQVPASARENVDGAKADAAPHLGTDPVVARAPMDVAPAQESTTDEVSGYLFQTGGGLAAEEEEELQT